jgi:hypothetical protein
MASMDGPIFVPKENAINNPGNVNNLVHGEPSINKPETNQHHVPMNISISSSG